MELIAGRVAVVTGASGDVGGAIAEALAAAGARVVLAGRDAGRLETLARRLRAASREVVTHAGDLADDEAVGSLAAAATAFGPVDLLVHAIGVFAAGPIGGPGATEALDLMFRVNARAPWLLTELLLSDLRARRGQVVFLNSTVGLRARAGVGGYAASKHALRALADSLRDEVNRDGVRVVSIFLGRTASAMQRRVCETEGKPYQPERLTQPADVAAAVLGALALPRTAEVTDLHLRPLAP
jgi:NADP-dependent 3-hydroxy acid dehydrogenase YdfG